MVKRSRFLIWLLLLSLLSISLSGIVSATEEPIKVYNDGNQIKFSTNPVSESGTTLVQFRPVFEALGISIEWDAESQTITGKKADLEIILKINDSTAIVNQQQVKLSVAAKIINGSTFVPLRFIGEASGKEVMWYEETRTIQIGKQDTNLAFKQLSNRGEVEKYLNDKYKSPLKTDVGDVVFNIRVTENTSVDYPYDYYVEFDFEMNDFQSILHEHSRSIDEKKRDLALTAKLQLKVYIEKMAKDLIARVPDCFR